jgi:hypothetical protein
MDGTFHITIKDFRRRNAKEKTPATRGQARRKGEIKKVRCTWGSAHIDKNGNQSSAESYQKCAAPVFLQPPKVGCVENAPKKDRITRIRWDGHDKRMNNDYRGLP